MRAKHPLIQFGRKFICHAREIVADDAHAAIRRLLFSRIVHPGFLCGQEALGICPYHFKQFYDDALPFEFVLLGTDDPGIFATTMRNEMALVLRRLNRMYPGRSEIPYEIVNHLIRNGRSYAFALADGATCG